MRAEADEDNPIEPGEYIDKGNGEFGSESFES